MNGLQAVPPPSALLSTTWTSGELGPLSAGGPGLLEEPHPDAIADATPRHIQAESVRSRDRLFPFDTFEQQHVVPRGCIDPQGTAGLCEVSHYE